jgi:hypothetical protein
MCDRGCLPERAVHGSHGRHVRVRGDDDGRAMGLEVARGHRVLMVLRLRLRLVVGVVPLRHLLVVGRRVRRSIVLRVVVRVVDVGVMDRRVRLRRQMVVLMVGLPSPGMGRHRGRVRTWHHGDRPSCCLHTWAPAGDQAATVRQRGAM